MATQFVLTDYVEQALSQAVYDKLEDGSFAGRIPACKGVIAFGNTLSQCQGQLCSVLEDWILLGLKMGHPLPVVAGIDLNPDASGQREPVETL
ncbi:MAG: type II toxin-antitoxin system HicB family antitoxin [Chloroflexi bacterium]|nr:type II toxin-antitoxin system HicB family antitoxin [Chloroflexota bacterium]